MTNREFVGLLALFGLVVAVPAIAQERNTIFSPSTAGLFTADTMTIRAPVASTLTIMWNGYNAVVIGADGVTTIDWTKTKACADRDPLASGDWTVRVCQALIAVKNGTYIEAKP